MIVRPLLRWLLTKLYRVKVNGVDQIKDLDENVIIVANHSSFLDVILLWVFLPIDQTFAVNTHIARSWMLRIASRLFETFPMDPTNPLSMRGLIKKVESGANVVIFPEGRITVTGSLMKIYQGPGMVSVRTGARILPVRIDGAQFSPFSRLRGLVRQRLFPQISLSVLPPEKLAVPENIRGRARRERAGKILSDIMTNMVFETSNYKTTLFDTLLDARKINGNKHPIAEDVQRVSLDYGTMLVKVIALGKALTAHTSRGEYVGIMMPSALSAISCALKSTRDAI